MEWLPFDLHPEYPPEGVDRATLEERYGAGFLEHTHRVVEDAGLPHAPPSRIPRSIRALQLGELARDEGRHEEIHRRLFRAHWSEGRDIGDLEVLAAIAGEAGLDPDKVSEVLQADGLAGRVRNSTEAAQHLGADGLPAWLLDDQLLVVGAQPHEVLEEVLGELGYSPRNAA